METGLNVRPPRVLERAISLLIPRTIREEIVGDLAERFQSPSRYVAETVMILPFLLFSQARRATHGSLFALQAFTIFVSFGGCEHGAESEIIAMWQRALIATLSSLTALLIRNAYRASEHWTSWRLAGDAAAMLLTTLAVQGFLVWLSSIGIVDPHWRVPDGFLVGGLFFSIVIVFVLCPGFSLAPNTRTPWARRPEAIEFEYQMFRRNLRFKNAVELCALCVLLAAVLLFSLNARLALVAAAGFAWVAVTLPITINRVCRARTSPMPPSLSIDAQVTFYRGELVKERNNAGFVQWCCFGPVLIGLALNMIARGLMNGWVDLAMGGVTAISVLVLMIIRASCDRRQQLARKIAALDRLGLSQPG